MTRYIPCIISPATFLQPILSSQSSTVPSSPLVVSRMQFAWRLPRLHVSLILFAIPSFCCIGLRLCTCLFMFSSAFPKVHPKLFSSRKYLRCTKYNILLNLDMAFAIPKVFVAHRGHLLYSHTFSLARFNKWFSSHLRDVCF